MLMLKTSLSHAAPVVFLAFPGCPNTQVAGSLQQVEEDL